MMMKKLLAVSMLLTLISVSIADDEIKSDQKITGRIATDTLRAFCPNDGIVTETATWRKLWGAWRPTQPIPDVDFQKQMVLVETVDGPRNVFVNPLKLKSNGELRYEIASTGSEGPGFAYLIMIVPKSGIRNVNGKPVPQPAIVQPAGQPEATTAVESVKVEITGRVKTGVMTFGAETTGAMIAADGIIWELDFQNDEQVIEAAQKLGASMAQVKGQLKRVSGTEVRDRWIVKVDSLAPVRIQPAVTQNDETQTDETQTNETEPAPQITISPRRQAIVLRLPLPGLRQPIDRWKTIPNRQR